MWRRHPEWVRTCGDCSQWVMDGRGEFVTYGPQNTRIPRADPPPCWTCPKQPESTPPDRRKPLPLSSDFGPWLWGLMSWFDQGRAVGFGEVSPLMREVAGVLYREEQAGRDERMERAMVEGLRRAARR